MRFQQPVRWLPVFLHYLALFDGPCSYSSTGSCNGFQLWWCSLPAPSISWSGIPSSSRMLLSVRVLPLAGEAGELPDENLLQGRGGTACVIDHLAGLVPVGDTAALGLVNALAGHNVAVRPGVVL